MVIVQRANKQLRVAESHLQHYLDKGYVEMKTAPETAPEENTPKEKKEKQEEKPKKAKK